MSEGCTLLTVRMVIWVNRALLARLYTYGVSLEIGWCMVRVFLSGGSCDVCVV